MTARHAVSTNSVSPIEKMNESALLYNSQINKIYLQYLRKYYPDIDVDSVLEEAGIANYEIEDPAHWFSQGQQDRLELLPAWGPDG